MGKVNKKLRKSAAKLADYLSYHFCKEHDTIDFTFDTLGELIRQLKALAGDVEAEPSDVDFDFSMSIEQLEGLLEEAKGGKGIKADKLSFRVRRPLTVDGGGGYLTGMINTKRADLTEEEINRRKLAALCPHAACALKTKCRIGTFTCPELKKHIERHGFCTTCDLPHATEDMCGGLFKDICKSCFVGMLEEKARNPNG